MKYQGSCHCGAIAFTFDAPSITSALKCNCSICERKGAMMTDFTLAPDELLITAAEDALSTYTFGAGVAKHHFCNRCGIYTFHQTMRKPGHYRINVGCIDGVDVSSLAIEVFDGKSL